MSVGVEKARSYSNVGQKLTHDSKTNNHSGINKENFNSLRNTQLSKAVIDKNNTLVLIEINKFRLMFKIYEKLKKMNFDQKTLQSVLGNEILKRVEFVADLILRGNEENSKKKAEKLGLKELGSYSNEECNSGIKKYVAVIKEYQRKYKNEVEVQADSTFMSLQNCLKEFLIGDKVHKEISKEENMLFYWMYEVLRMSPTVRKDELDSIIEGKKMLQAEVLASKVKELS